MKLMVEKFKIFSAKNGRWNENDSHIRIAPRLLEDSLQDTMTSFIAPSGNHTRKETADIGSVLCECECAGES